VYDAGANKRVSLRTKIDATVQWTEEGGAHERYLYRWYKKRWISKLDKELCIYIIPQYDFPTKL
jgi:hypothetical protein